MTTSVATVRGDVRDDDVEVGRLHQSYIQRMSVARYMSAGNEPKLTNAIRVYCSFICAFSVVGGLFVVVLFSCCQVSCSSGRFRTKNLAGKCKKQEEPNK